MEDNEIRCPQCGSHSLTAGNKGFGVGKAAIGGLLLGPVGLLAGGIGSNKVKITCLNCGHTFTPEEWQAYKQDEERRKRKQIAFENEKKEKEAELSHLSDSEKAEAIKEWEQDKIKKEDSQRTILVVSILVLMVIAIIAALSWVNWP